MCRLALAALWLMGLSAFAWGPEGHSLVARIAEANLTPEARAQIHAILNQGESLPALASWADQVRRSRPETESWHYVDIPISRPALDMARDCPPKGCVLSAIEEFRKVLADRTATPARRREALLFIVHFMGDMHQPLHCSDDGDKGGNQVTVEFHGDRMNLHRLWDSAMLDRMTPEEELYVKLSHAATGENQKVWSRGTPQDWADEAHHIAKMAVYGRLPGVPKTEPAHITDTYETTAQAIIEQQIERAGTRLAFVLNQALASN